MARVTSRGIVIVILAGADNAAISILNIVRERNPAKTEHRAQIFTQEITPVRVKRDIPEETVKQK